MSSDPTDDPRRRADHDCEGKGQPIQVGWDGRIVQMSFPLDGGEVVVGLTLAGALATARGLKQFVLDVLVMEGRI